MVTYAFKAPATAQTMERLERPGPDNVSSSAFGFWMGAQGSRASSAVWFSLYSFYASAPDLDPSR